MVKPRILLATRNPGKQREIREIMADTPYDIAVPDELGVYPAPIEGTIESATSFEGNARLKAEYFHGQARIPTIAEDSGLEVLSLGGAPGVRSRRFALATDNQDDANNQELLRRLAGAPPARRAARYRCAVVLLARRGALIKTFEGECVGRILEAPDGTGGFGYDPLFFSEDLQQSFGNASPDEKHRVSHRGRAINALIAWLEKHPLFQ